MTDSLPALCEQLRGPHRSPMTEEAADALERLAKELEDAKRERDSYYMDYRLKCDAESKAANVRADKAESALAQMREERDRLKDGHCKDCCCARIWKALGVESYTGLSIWEHVEKMREERDAARQAAQTHWDERQKETRELEAEIDRLRAALERVEWVAAVATDGDICPWCWQWREDGHTEHCPRQMALGLTGGNQ